MTRTPAAGATHPRRRGAALPSLLAALLLVLAALAGCSGDDGDDRAGGDGAAPDGRAAGDEDRGDGGEEEGDEATRPFAVGRIDVTLVDPSRGTDAVPAADVEARPDRTIDLTVVYPAAGDPGEEPTIPAAWSEDGDPEGRSAVLDAEPADGPFPLLVWAHGWNGQGASFLPHADRWARAGYVVALPTFPLSRAGIGHSDDMRNQPEDIWFVIDHLLGDDGPLPGLVDGERIALGGHSLGSATVFRAVYNGCCTDDRVDATITVAGGPLDITEGYQDQPDVPMLLAHGAADPGVAVAVSDAMVDFVTAPVTYLRFTGADHTSVFAGTDGELFSDASIAYLDATLGDDDEALDGIGDLVAESGVAELRTG